MAVTTQPPALAEQITAVPLRPIRTDKQYKGALRVIEAALGVEDLPRDASDHLDVLILLVQSYEERICPDEGDASGLDMLRFLMEENQLKQTDLARILDCSPSLASMILAGRRQITKEHGRKLAQRFKVDPGLFL